MNKNLIEKYLKYAQTEEAYAVLFVKKYLKKAENKWIDIISLDAGAKAEELEFTSLNCELFERKIKPKYPNRKEYLSEEEYEQACRAITWKTAHEDIQKQRLKGICGTRYYIKVKDFEKLKIYISKKSDKNNT